MSFLGNIIWLVTSFFVPIGYLIGGIILFPLLPFIYPVIGYSFLPFGREIVSTKYLKQFKEAEIEAMETAGFAQTASLMDVPWFELRALSNHWGVSDHRHWEWDLCKNQLARAAKMVAEGPLRSYD